MGILCRHLVNCLFNDSDNSYNSHGSHNTLNSHNNVCNDSDKC